MYILGTEFSSTGKREPMWKTQGLLDSRMWRFLLLTRGTRHSQDTSKTWKSLWKVIWILYHIIREHLPAKKFLSCIAQITFPPFSQIWASWSFFPGRQKLKNGLKAARDIICASSCWPSPLKSTTVVNSRPSGQILRLCTPGFGFSHLSTYLFFWKNPKNILRSVSGFPLVFMTQSQML